MVIIADYFFFQIATKLMGKYKAKVAFYIYFFNREITMHLVHCLSNTFELILIQFIFYYSLENDYKEKNFGKIIFYSVVLFMTRSSSIIILLPLIMYQLLNNFKCYIRAGIETGIPTIIFVVLLDSVNYG